MSEKKPYIQPAITRRQFAAATVGLLLAACGRSTTDTSTATREVAQAQATPTLLPPTETPVPADTATAAPSETAAPEPTPAPSATATLEPTPMCDDDDDETPAQTEGPFYTPDTPERTSFLEDGPGTRLVVTGRVLSTTCVPIGEAILDFWHADNNGQYDNTGYRFRGHQFTDADGTFRLETIVPAIYPGRTRHIHVKVQGPNTPLLTTQLYFPNEPQNETDRIFNPVLLMDVQDADEGKVATFDFVLEQA